MSVSHWKYCIQSILHVNLCVFGVVSITIEINIPNHFQTGNDILQTVTLECLC